MTPMRSSENEKLEVTKYSKNGLMILQPVREDLIKTMAPAGSCQRWILGPTVALIFGGLEVHEYCDWEHKTLQVY